MKYIHPENAPADNLASLIKVRVVYRRIAACDVKAYNLSV